MSTSITHRLLGALAPLLVVAASACAHGDRAHDPGAGPGSTAASCTDPGPGGRILRRLSRGEYDATVHDLLGLDAAWGASLTADTVVNGFDNNASALVVSPLLADQLRKAAEEIAAAALASPASILPCAPAAGDAACAAAFVASFGKRAFRRPLLADEKARYLALHAGVAAKDGFALGVQTVIAAMLQSPSFLYRAELGEGGAGSRADTTALAGYEVASELSYFFWGSMPDDALFAAAEAGELGTPNGIEKQARRLLADPRSDAALARFVEQWLEIDRLPNIAKDSATYPAFTAGMRVSMRDETRHFVRHVVREGTGALPEIFLADYAFVNADLAAVYGLAAPSGASADGFAQVGLGGGDRAGILTQGSVLATHSRPNSSSPIHRGKLVRERLFCQDMPPPPPGLNVQPPPLDPTLTTRERYAAHASVQPCKSCHQLIDPIGFGFERFDGIGSHRDTENGKPIDASGDILATQSTDGAFDGVKDLANRLAQSPDVQACFARQWLRFAYGVSEKTELACLATQVGQTFASGGLRLDDLMVALTRTAHFRERARDGSEGAAGSGSGGAGGAGGAASAGSSGGTGTASASGAGGAGGAGGADAGPPGEPGLTVTTMVDSQWATGYQETVTLTNTGTAALTWTVSLPVQGKIANVWNATAAPAGAKTTFVGAAYNAVLAPQATTSFGFVTGQ